MEKLLNSSKTRIEFIINQDAKIYLLVPSGVKKTSCYDFSEIMFSHNKKSIVIAPYEPILYNLREFGDALKKVLFKQIELPKEVSDIGLIHEEMLQKEREEVSYRESEELCNWIGFEFNVWRMPESNFTWLYRQNGFIKLTISKAYSWSLSDSASKRKSAETFDEFVKNYQPIADYIISRETAVKWLQQADDIVKTIERSFVQ